MIRLAAALVLFASPVMAANCAPRDVVVERLTGKYGESLVAIGVSDGNMMGVYANRDTGSWTITVTLPAGIMCVVGAGQAFETLKPAKTGERL